MKRPLMLKLFRMAVRERGCCLRLLQRLGLRVNRVKMKKKGRRQGRRRGGCGAKGGNRFVLLGVNGKVGEMTYRLVDVNNRLIGPAYVDPRYRGTEDSIRMSAARIALRYPESIRIGSGLP